MPEFGRIGWGTGAFGNVAATLPAPKEGTIDLGAVLQPHRIEDLQASIEIISAVDLGAILSPVPHVNLPAEMFAIAGKDLAASAGGHLPEDIPAILAAVRPVDLPVFIRGGGTGTIDLGGSLTQTGAFKDLSAFVRTALPDLKDLKGVIRVIANATADLPALLLPFHVTDLGADIITQRVFDTRAIIYGFARECESNISAILRRSDSAVTDLPVAPLKANTSTHTSDKKINLTKVARPFFQNRYVFGTVDAGLLLLTLEPIFGFFPDLHAQIFAQQFFRDNIAGFVRPVFPALRDLSADTTSVGPFVNADKILLDLIPFINLEADLDQVGVILPTRASITPRVEAATTTADDAGFVTTASSYRFFLGTSKGLFIPPQVVPTIRITTYTNNSPTPDLHATIAGWYETDLGASIKDYPFVALSASILSLDASRINNISAFLAPFRSFDLSASATPTGEMEDIPGSLTVQGKISDLTATISTVVDALAFNIVSVSTVPTFDLAAIINYGANILCVPKSQIAGLSGYLRPLVTGTPETIQNFPATLNVLRRVITLPAEIISRKRTRIQVLSLTFRSKTRDSEPIRGSITPVAPGTIELSASISGLSHEINLPATINPVRFAPPKVEFTVTETLTDIQSGFIKDVLLSFRSQVSLYVYEEVANSVFETDKGTWAIDLRTLLRDESFFDRAEANREFVLDDIQEFFSLDEAIRNALVLLCERRQAFLPASLVATGQITDLGVQIGITSADRINDLITSLVAVANSPDITASININTQSSTLLSIIALIAGVTQEQGDVGGSIIGHIVEDLGAEITPS